MPRITEQSFYKYLKCPSWIARERDEGQIQDAILERLQAEGLLDERARELLAKRPFVEVTRDDLDEAQRQTMDFMRRGAQTIFRGVLIHGDWVGGPDVLERVEGHSNFGDWYYVAVDIKRSSRIKDEHKFQGCFYAELLAKIQGLKPVQGYVMFQNGTVESYLLDETFTQYRLTLDAIERILDGREEPHFLTSGCKQSPYFSECVEASKSCDDLSLINRIWRTEVTALQAAGITGVTQLARAGAKDRHSVAGLPPARVDFLSMQARSLIDDIVIVLGQVILPTALDNALVVDVESDPLRDADYLIGILDISKEGQTYLPFLARNPTEEKQAWEQFVQFVQNNPDQTIFHYGWYEVDVFRRLAAKYGAPKDFLEKLEGRMVDVLVRLREKVIFPMPFYSLKDIAKYLGYKWRSSEASGRDSILWYDEWLKTGDESILNDIVAYNEDDVAATWMLVEWALRYATAPAEFAVPRLPHVKS